MTILRQRIGSMRIPYGKRISNFSHLMWMQMRWLALLCRRWWIQLLCGRKAGVALWSFPREIRQRMWLVIQTESSTIWFPIWWKESEKYWTNMFLLPLPTWQTWFRSCSTISNGRSTSKNCRNRALPLLKLLYIKREKMNLIRIWCRHVEFTI